MNCDFCNTKKLDKRIFYCQEDDDSDKHKYFAFLAATPHTRGHTILAVFSPSRKCPRQLNITTLSRLGDALSDVIKVINAHYAPKNILFASLRGDVKHIHIHLIPLYKDEESEWRKVTGYENSHLMEFIGTLEKKGNYRELRLEAKGISIEQQRTEFEKDPKTAKDIKRLRNLARYEGIPNQSRMADAQR